jgi:Uma2 family endonuclease
MNVQARSSPFAADASNLFVDTPLRMTTKEFFVFTQQTERLFQLLNGRPMVNPTPTMKHQKISRNLYSLLDAFVVSNRLGEVWYAPCDIVLDKFDVVQPDLFFIAADRAHIVTERNVQGAPDLIVEILSTSTAHLDRGYKQYLYAVKGVREYWLIDPDARQIEVLSQGGSGYTTTGIYGQDETVISSMLSGLRIAVNDIFAGV